MSKQNVRMSREDVLSALKRREAIDLVNADVNGVKFSALMERGDAQVAWSRLELAADAKAADVANEEQLPQFDMVLYTGAPIRQWWSRYPLVLDLAGIDLTAKRRPVLADHWTSHDMVVGHTTDARVESNMLRVKGVISGIDESAQRVVKLAKRGFPWQASIGASFDKVEFIEEMASVNVNGRTVNGPVYVIRQSHFDEASFVVLGADDDTEAKVAARLGRNPQQESAMTTKQESGVVSANAPAAAAPSTNPTDSTVTDVRMKIADEYKRIAAIEEKAKGRPNIIAQAVAEGWSLDKVEATVLKAELEDVRASRAPAGAPGIISGDKDLSFRTLEAAVCIQGKLANVEKIFSERELEAASKTFRRGLGLQELFCIAAAMNGHQVRSFKQDPQGVLRAAFSTIEMSGLLSNTANKFLLDGWNAIDQSWRAITKVGNVSDFKQMSSYRMHAGGGYQLVNGTGEIKHGALAETGYTNQAQTYAELFAITRQDIYNDDLGAITNVPMILGQDAAHKFNDIFWTLFVGTGIFHPSFGNYFSGASTNLQLSSLATAESMFWAQTTPSGKPLGIKPSILLVPPQQATTARQLFNSTEVRPTSTAKEPVGNPFAGLYQPVVSPYLSSAGIASSSQLAWWLLADPRVLATMEAVFLDGKETPTVETADADFATLGVQMRGYHDFGVNTHERRAGVKSKGEA